jgi:hypothetical protein
MQPELAKLIKALTTLSNLVIIYLFITWSYAGLEFLLRSILQ